MRTAIFVGLTFVLVFPAFAQTPYVYPAKGQSEEQLNKDKYECHQWAIDKSGYDPMVVAGAQPQQKGVLGGAAKGAAVGAIGGAIAGDAGKGAAVGAAVGGVGRGMKNRQNRRELDEAKAGARDEWTRAYTVCLEGRGYSVK